MVSNVLANLDRSRAVIPEGKLNQFILHRDGTVSSADASLRGLYYSFIEEPLPAQAGVLQPYFTQVCAQMWSKESFGPCKLTQNHRFS